MATSMYGFAKANYSVLMGHFIVIWLLFRY